MVTIPKPANSATQAHACRRPKSNTSRCASVLASTETDSTTAATTSPCASRAGARSATA